MVLVISFPSGSIGQDLASVTLAWDPSVSFDVIDYVIYYGPSSQRYTNKVSVGKLTTCTVTNLIAGATYCFAATAVDAAGNESVFSNEVTYQVPNPPPTVVLSSLPGSSYTSPGTLGLSANVTTHNHRIKAVLFYRDSTLLGQVTAPPYVFTWSQIPAGNASLTARLIYENGSNVISAPMRVAVTNGPPGVLLASPANRASFTAPADISLAANVNPNGHSISGVEFYSGSALLGKVSAPPYGMVWTNVSAGSYSLTARMTYDSTRTVLTQPTSVTVTNLPASPPANLPAPWQAVDLGQVAVPGTATLLGTNSWAVSGAGIIGGTDDSFRFVCQPMTGDGFVQAQLTTVQASSAGGCFGIMVRETLTSNSAYVLLSALPDGTFRWQSRTNTGGSTLVLQAGKGALPNIVFLVMRVRDTLYAYRGNGAGGWTYVTAINIPMGLHPYAGLVVSSDDADVDSAARFDSVYVLQ